MQSDDSQQVARDTELAAKAGRLAGRVMQRVAGKLRRGRGVEAVRLFTEAQAHEAIPKTGLSTHWLTSVLGAETAAQLVTAFAHFPCPYCKNGLEQCDACDGKGMRGEDMMCRTCLGGGWARCEFCNGTGLATYAFVPQELRPAVLWERSHMAMRQLERLTSRPPVAGSDARKLFQFVLNLDKLLGVLENAVMVAGELDAAGHCAHETAASLVHECKQTALTGMSHVRQAIHHLASASDDAGAEMPLRRPFYEAMAQEKSFEGTLLHHPFLH